MKRISFLLSVFLLQAALGCMTENSPKQETNRESTLTPVPTLTKTLSPSEIPFPTETETMPAPTESLPIRSTLESSGLLDINDEGPWLMHSPRFREGNNYEDSIYGLALTNLDGSGLRLLDIEYTYRFQTYALQPYAGNAEQLLVVRVFEKGYDFELVEDNVHLWVISLPSGKILQRISLLSEIAVETIEEAGDDWFANSPLSIAFMSRFRWSPNGRYLAFSGAIDSTSADIYVYDAMLDEVRYLGGGEYQEVIYSWSPDSQWVLTQAGEFFDVPSSPVQSIDLISIDGSIEEFQIGPANFDHINTWINDKEFIMSDGYFEGERRNLRLVNIETKEFEMLFESGFYSSAADPVSETIMLSMVEDVFHSPESPDGIYNLSEPNELELVLPGTYRLVVFDEQMGMFRTQEEENAIILFNKEGVHCRLPYGKFRGSSPNGQWILISDTNGTQLYSRDCQLVSTMEEKGEVYWLHDSSGFYIYGTTISIYMQNKGWQQEIVNSQPTFKGYDEIIFP